MTTDPTPPAFDDIPRTSGGSPITAHGLSWKAAGAVLIVLVGLAVSWGALNQKLDTVLVAVADLHASVDDHGEWIAGAKVRLRRVEADIAGLKRRRRGHAQGDE